MEYPTFEEWMREQLRQGKDDEVLALLNVFPEELKKKYRQVWKEEKGIKNDLPKVSEEDGWI